MSCITLPTWSDGNSLLISNNHSVLTSHRAVQEITEIVKVVIGSKHACVNSVLLHVISDTGQAPIHFFGGKQLLALKCYINIGNLIFNLKKSKFQSFLSTISCTLANETFLSRFSDFSTISRKKKTISELRAFLTEKHKHLSTMYKLFKVVKTNNYTFWPLCSLSVRGK